MNIAVMKFMNKQNKAHRYCLTKIPSIPIKLPLLFPQLPSSTKTTSISISQQSLFPLKKMERSSPPPVFENDDLHLRLGLPGRDDSEQPSSSHAKINSNKRSSSQMQIDEARESAAPPPKAQVVGWPPVRSGRKRAEYVKVSMDGAPYLRKIDLKTYSNYSDLLKSLESMFKCSMGVYSEREGFKGSEFRPTYQDKDGDWMLAGDVPWEMFITSCKRLRIMKASDAKGLPAL